MNLLYREAGLSFAPCPLCRSENPSSFLVLTAKCEKLTKYRAGYSLPQLLQLALCNYLRGASILSNR
jgi:hypothetical protein